MTKLLPSAVLIVNLLVALSNAVDDTPATEVVDTLVTCPFALTVMTGTNEPEP